MATTGGERVPNQQSSELTPVNSTSSGSNKNIVTRRAFLRKAVEVSKVALWTPIIAPLLNQPGIARAEIKAADKEAEKPSIRGGSPMGDVGQGPLIERQPTAFKLAVNESGTTKLNQATKSEGDASDQDANLSNPTVAETPTQAPGPNDEGPQPPETSEEIDLPPRNVEAAAVSAPSEEDSIVQQAPAIAPSPIPAAKPTGRPGSEIVNRERYLAELPNRFKNLEFLPNPLKGKSPAFDSEVEPTRKALGELLLIAAQVGAVDQVQIIFEANHSKPKYNTQFSQYSWGGLVLEPSDQYSIDDPLAWYMSLQMLSEPTVMPNQNFLEPIIEAKTFSKGVNDMWPFANFFMVAERIKNDAKMIDQRRTAGDSGVKVAEDYGNGTTAVLGMWKAYKDFVAFANSHHNQLASQGLKENSVVTSLINNWNNGNNMTIEEGMLLRLRSLLRYWNVRFTEEDLDPSILSQLN